MFWIGAATVRERYRPESRQPSLTVGALIVRALFQHWLEHAIALPAEPVAGPCRLGYTAVNRAIVVCGAQLDHA